MRVREDCQSWVEFFLVSLQGKRVMEATEESENLYTPDTALAELRP